MQIGEKWAYFVYLRSIKPLILEVPNLLKNWREVSVLQEYSLETGLATVIDGSDILRVSIEQLKDLKFQVGSVYQFIGELLIQSDNKAILQARVGRNVDGIDLNLYHQSLLLLRQFQANHLNNSAT
ncbi:CST complex subunit TEN1 isoform X2 [Trifolium pratense]|uniref:CST complex subunit TEN1 isoform X2 n=1 Tax=Trifolium pratense TaxID=57577 RepID=UPI001E696C05|nr:CST complex subunit TEN1 isoform X2 [Trifolium pratense]